METNTKTTAKFLIVVNPRIFKQGFLNNLKQQFIESHPEKIARWGRVGDIESKKHRELDILKMLVKNNAPFIAGIYAGNQDDLQKYYWKRRNKNNIDLKILLPAGCVIKAQNNAKVSKNRLNLYLYNQPVIDISKQVPWPVIEVIEWFPAVACLNAFKMLEGDGSVESMKASSLEKIFFYCPEKDKKFDFKKAWGDRNNYSNAPEFYFVNNEDELASYLSKEVLIEKPITLITNNNSISNGSTSTKMDVDQNSEEENLMELNEFKSDEQEKLIFLTSGNTEDSPQQSENSSINEDDIPSLKNLENASDITSGSENEEDQSTEEESKEDGKALIELACFVIGEAILESMQLLPKVNPHKLDSSTSSEKKLKEQDEKQQHPTLNIENDRDVKAIIEQTINTPDENKTEDKEKSSFFARYKKPFIFAGITAILGGFWWKYNKTVNDYTGTLFSWFGSVKKDATSWIYSKLPNFLRFRPVNA